MFKVFQVYHMNLFGTAMCNRIKIIAPQKKYFAILFMSSEVFP